jgi:hypothetical protein
VKPSAWRTTSGSPTYIQRGTLDGNPDYTFLEKFQKGGCVNRRNPSHGKVPAIAMIDCVKQRESIPWQDVPVFFGV